MTLTCKNKLQIKKNRLKKQNHLEKDKASKRERERFITVANFLEY